jgi:hypothetical protein
VPRDENPALGGIVDVELPRRVADVVEDGEPVAGGPEGPEIVEDETMARPATLPPASALERLLQTLLAKFLARLTERCRWQRKQAAAHCPAATSNTPQTQLIAMDAWKSPKPI